MNFRFRTVATDEDGRWTDEFGAIYSANKKMLISCPPKQLSYTVLDETEVICEHAGEGSNIESIVISDSVIVIGDYAFNHNTYLKEIHIGNSVERIGMQAFYYCPYINNINIPASLKEVGETFCNSEVNNVHFDYNNPYFTFDCGALLSKDRTQFYILLKPNNPYYIVPDGVKKIHRRAIYGNSDIDTILVNDGVEELESEAFANNWDLFIVRLPSSIKQIPPDLLDKCNGFDKIELPDNASEELKKQARIAEENSYFDWFSYYD